MAEQKTLDAKTAARREYYREWRRNHPEKVKATRDRFWAKQAERFANAAAVADMASPVSLEGRSMIQ